MTTGTRWLRAAPAAVTAAGALLLAWGLAGGGERARAANASVSVSNFQFAPANVSIGNDEKVTWTSVSGSPHTITSDTPGLFDNDPATAGFEWTATVSNTVVSYRCVNHPSSMQGTITVGTPPNTPTNTPVTPSATTTTPTATNTPTATPTVSPSPSPSPSPTVPRHEVIAPNVAKN